MSYRKQAPQRDWGIILFLLLVAGCLIYLLSGQCSGQTIPQQQPQLYAIPRPVYFPWVRYNILGWGTPVDYYRPVGAPYQATVQPVAPYYPRAW